MTKYVDSNLVPGQYEIHEEDGDRFIFAQPAGEKYIIQEKPSHQNYRRGRIGLAAFLVVSERLHMARPCPLTQSSSQSADAVGIAHKAHLAEISIAP